MGRNKNYVRSHLLEVLKVCRNWSNFDDAYNFISKSGAVEAYQPGLTKLKNMSLSNLNELEVAVKYKYKEYDYL